MTSQTSASLSRKQTTNSELKEPVDPVHPIQRNYLKETTEHDTDTSRKNEVIIRPIEKKDFAGARRCWRDSFLNLEHDFYADSLFQIWSPVSYVLIAVSIGVYQYGMMRFPNDGSPALTFVCVTVLIYLGMMWVLSRINFRRYIDHVLNTEMNDIEKHFMTEGRAMLIAEMKLPNGKTEIIGTVGLRHFEFDGPKADRVMPAGEEERWSIKNTAELCRFAVLPEYQGRGVGKQLINHFTDICRKRNFERVFLTTSSIQKGAFIIYTRMGFRECVRGFTHKINGDGYFWGLANLTLVGYVLTLE
jgi:ribosomal protein S18 acetylase RimI-like enzyme